MKKFLVLLFVFILFLLCGCTPGAKNNSDTVSQTDQISNSTSQNNFEVNSFKTKDGNDSYYFETTHDELIAAINEAVTKAGYPPFVLVDTYISTNDDLSDSYYYKMEGKTGRLDIQVFHGNGFLYLVYMDIYDSESEMPLDQFLMETLSDIFTSGKGKEVCTQLDIYSMKPTDPTDWRSTTIGNTDFDLSIPYEFGITTTEY
ncbi:hypothetical protein GH808_04435 [Acetobacterium fimetarium]|uniref:DUF5067 domain-containing protein n=1 Tax=Acetobacterium fimetarium TaxID=52691 RepID=A0ABR6WSY7_9FIRM|nr:hypothetical protein [Acetobacterium fimetarium]MBC3803681.1 hypothetical protein [Acetobacterium fimetarium]